MIFSSRLRRLGMYGLLALGGVAVMSAAGKLSNEALAHAAPPSWTSAEAAKLATSNAVSLTAVETTARAKLTASGVTPSPADISTVATQILQEANKKNDASITKLQAQVAAAKKKPLKDGPQGQKSTPNPMSTELELKLQLAMDRRAKFTEALSNLMKKSSDTSSQIISNMK